MPETPPDEVVDLSDEQIDENPVITFSLEEHQEGTRKAMALTLLGFMIALFVALIAYVFLSSDPDSDKIQLATNLYTTFGSPIVTLVASVIAFYFGSKNS